MIRRFGTLRRLSPFILALLVVVALALTPASEPVRDWQATLGGLPSSQPPTRGVPVPDPSCAEDPARLPPPANGPDGQANYLHTCGGQLYSATGAPAQITGISWFGQEGSGYAPHGLDLRNWRSLLDQVATLGFNTLRLPYTNEMLRPGARVSGIDFQLNPDLRDLGPLELLDKLIAGARERGLRVILDRHRPDSGGQSALWYTANVSEDQWIADWRTLARRYAGNDTVIGVDLHNEPKDQATWGSGDLATDWRLAAERAGNAVLDENPYLLIFVQGIQWSPWVSHWWGGNLQSVRDNPVRLKVPNRVVYSPHDYGPSVFPQPWFWDGDFPDNLMAIWQEDWGYLRSENIAPVVVGEFGGRSTGPDRDGVWQQALVDYLRDNDIGYLHWSLNPDSSDTGGILTDDWRTVQPARMALLSRYLAPPLSTGTAGLLGPPREGLTALARLAAASDGRVFELRVRNDGPEAVFLSRLEVRASLDGVSGSLPRVVAAGRDMPDGQLNAQLVPDSAGERLSLRLTFGEGAGTIAGYGESADIAVRVDGVGALALAPGAAFQPAEGIALYRDGQLAWGKRPMDGALPSVPAGGGPANGSLPTPVGSRFLAGASYAPQAGAELGAAAGPSKAGAAAEIEADFANLSAAGVQVVKFWVFGPANLPRDERGQLSALSESFYADLDATLALAARHNLYVVLSLFDPDLFAGTCPAGTATDDLTGVLSDASQRGALIDRLVTPLIDRTVGNPRVLAYEVLAQPTGGWGGGEQDAQRFAREVVALIHGRGKQMATALVPPDSVGQWSGLGLDYYSVRWSGETAAQQTPPVAAALKLDRPVVIGELAANGPRLGVGDVLGLAIGGGYAGAFVGSAGHESAPLWRGDFLAWARRHWTALALTGDGAPSAVREAQVASYGIDHLRLQVVGSDLVAEMRLRAGGSGTGRIAVMLLPIAGGVATVAEQSVTLDAQRGTLLRARFPGLAEWQGYRLAALLRDERGVLLGRFDGLADFVLKQGDLAAPAAVEAPNRCHETGAQQATLLWGDWLASLGDHSAPKAPVSAVSGGTIESLTSVPSGPVSPRLPAGVSKEQVAKADLPVALAFAPDGRLFFAELRTGRVRILERGAPQREPFYTLAVSGQPQAGLLGLTLDPDFARNHYVYVLYTSAQGERTGGLNGPNRLLRLTEVSGRGTAPLLLAGDLPSDFVANGGGLRFGPDGYLYVGLGAGANQGQAADLSSQAGKVLRFDVQFAGVGAGQALGSLFARGLGSPFGLAFHPTTGQLYATDAAGALDELNLVIAGGNYGAPAVGFQHDERLVDPIFAYWPARQSTGLEFYRGNRLPGWQNDLFYCNARRGELHRVRLTPPAYDRLVSDEIVTTGCQFAVASGPEGALYFTDEHGIYRLVGR